MIFIVYNYNYNYKSKNYIFQCLFFTFIDLDETLCIYITLFDL